MGPGGMPMPASTNKEPEVITWNVSHYDDATKYAVAAELATASEGGDYKAMGHPISFLAAVMPVQYRVKDIIKFAYENDDSENMLKIESEATLVEYLASADMLKVMSSSRQDAVNKLKKRIQEKADRMELGIEIVNVNLHDLHPPVQDVAPAFQEVIGAGEEKRTLILAADIDAIKYKGESDIETSRIITEANTYSESVKKLSKAEKERFASQLKAYRTMPRLYLLRTYLEFLENDCATFRKFIVPPRLDSEVIEVNLEEKPRLDLIDTNLSTEGDKAQGGGNK